MLLSNKSMAFHSKQHNHRHAFSPNALVFLVYLQLVAITFSADPESQEALLKLKMSFNNDVSLSSWNPILPPCVGAKSNWVGITCSKDGSIYALRLENMSLAGEIDANALSGLGQLRSISLMDNALDGPIPNTLKTLKALKSISLSNNKFEGKIDPNVFSGLNKLRRLYMANNKLMGQIPTSLAKLPRLTYLRLEGNQFTGKIPEFSVTSFHDLSLANNQLEGQIPKSLSYMTTDPFVGNPKLCGTPLDPCPKTANTSSQHETPTKQPLPPPPASNSNTSVLIAIAIVLIVILLAIFVILKRRKPKPDPMLQGQPVALPLKMDTADDINEQDGEGDTGAGARGDSTMLCFVREGGERFDLPNLLRAEAEILGSGCFGSSYKASLESGSIMVVKRFRQMNNVGKEEFQEHMRRIGRIQHKNVVSLVAYYYRKEEKLLVSEFVQRGSLAAHLHGNHSREQPSLDWPTRLNIIKGVARGLSYIYKDLALLTTPHGHLKSSNVLLDKSFNPLIHDYGLIPLINQESAQQLLVAYKSPEYSSNGRINKKTDVWSLGILIIEVMTGQFPSIYLQQGKGADLSSWVKEIVGDPTRHRVFDKSMRSTTNDEGEMHKLLDIGLACCESDVEKRLDIKEACVRIEEVKERDSDDDFYSLVSEGDMHSSRTMSDDFTISLI